MECLEDTSENDMSFEYTGPAKLVSPPYNVPSHFQKRDFATFASDDQSFRPAQQLDRIAFDDNNANQVLDVTSFSSSNSQAQEVSSWMHWGMVRSIVAFNFTCEILRAVYAATVIASIPVAAAKRRLISFTERNSTAAPVRRLLWPRRNTPRIFRQNVSSSPGLYSTTRITPPRFRPLASSPFHVPGRYPVSPIIVLDDTSHNSRSPTFGTPSRVSASAQDNVAITTLPITDHASDTEAHQAGSAESSMFSDDSLIEDMIPEIDNPSPISHRWADPVLDSYQLAAIQELKTIREMSKRSIPPPTPRPKVTSPKFDLPLERYRSSLLSSNDRSQPSDGPEISKSEQAKVQTLQDQPHIGSTPSNSVATPMMGPALHPPISQSATTTGSMEHPIAENAPQCTEVSDCVYPKQPLALQQPESQTPASTGSIESSQPPTFLKSEQLGSPSLGLIESTRSPATAQSEQSASEITGSIDSNRSPASQGPQQQISITGLIDSNRSPATQEPQQQISITGSIDLNRSPAAQESDKRIAEDILSAGLLSPLTEQNLALQPSGTNGLIELTRSPSPVSLQRRQTSTPLRSSMASNYAKVSMTPIDSLRTAPAKGLLHRVLSSIKTKKRSPLRDSFNNANARNLMMKTPKSARFLENPVTGTKKYVKNEAISYPSPISSRDENSFLGQVTSPHTPETSPTQQEQDALIAIQLTSPSPKYGHDPEVESSASMMAADYDRIPDNGSPGASSDDSNNGEGSENSSTEDESVKEPVPVTPTKSEAHEPKTPPNDLSRDIAGLTMSGRRISDRTRLRQEKEERLRAEEAATAAAEKARKEKEEAEEKARKDRVKAEEKARKDQAEAEANERRRLELEEELKKSARRMPIEKVIQPLSEEWEAKVAAALATGPRAQVGTNTRRNPITRRDIGMVLPQPGSGDDRLGWLNDVIIEAYLLAVVAHANGDLKRTQTPKQHAFNSFFYKTIEDGTVDKVLRWTKKAKMAGKDLLKVEWIFIPVNVGTNHWTLLAVSGTKKTIEYFDSMGGAARPRIDNIKTWLKAELGSAYKDEEWKVIEDPARPGKGKGPQQNNASDCGVFTVTNAKMISLGVDPMAFSASDTPTQRRRIVAEILHGSFSGDFEPKIVFE